MQVGIIRRCGACTGPGRGPRPGGGRGALPALLSLPLLLLLLLLLLPAAHAQAHADTEHFLTMIIQIHENCLRKIMALNHIKLKSQFHPAFETGFLNCRIQERYRKMVDKVKTYQDLHQKVSWNSLDVLIMLEEVEDLFWEITHLVGMLHEIERKWNVNIPTNEPYRDTTTTKTTTTVSRWIHTKANNDSRYTKQTKKRKQSTPFLLKEFSSWTSTHTKTPRHPGRLWDYGWELNYDWWNIHPNLGRQKW